MYVALALQLRRIAPWMDMWTGLSCYWAFNRAYSSAARIHLKPNGYLQPFVWLLFAEGLQAKPPFVLIYSALNDVMPSYSSTTLNAWRTIAIALGIDCWLSTSINTPQSR